MSDADCVTLEIVNVPTKLLEDFDKIVTECYPGGRSEAIRDLMRKAIREKTGN